MRRYQGVSTKIIYLLARVFNSLDDTACDIVDSYLVMIKQAKSLIGEAEKLNNRVVFWLFLDGYGFLKIEEVLERTSILFGLLHLYYDLMDIA